MPRIEKRLHFVKQNITLIGEGITEQFYFKHIKNLLGYRFILKPYFFETTSFKEMDKKINDVLLGNGIAICVFDKDVAERDEKEKKKLNTLFNKYSKKKNVIFCDSLPSIEYWFYLHYVNTNKFFNDSISVERELRKKIKDYEKKEHFLKNEKWVSDLCSDNKLETAIERAIKFGSEGASYSNVYKAFLKLRQSNF